MSRAEARRSARALEALGRQALPGPIALAELGFGRAEVEATTGAGVTVHLAADVHESLIETLEVRAELLGHDLAGYPMGTVLLVVAGVPVSAGPVVRLSSEIGKGLPELEVRR